jgi:hypothetical protein
MTPPGYTAKRIYVIICQRCNEDIIRPMGGDDVTTRAGVDAAISEHEEIFHGGTGA